VVPDARRPLAHEIYSIDRVVATSPDNKQIELHPFYSVRHAVEGRQQRAFWHATRRPAGYAAGQIDRGTEVFLSIVDLDFLPSAPADWTLDVETTCLNRDLPRRLPFGGGQPRLQLSSGAPLSRVACLTPPTPTLRPLLQRGTLWRLISHLSLNHLSLVDSEHGADALREILKLYDFMDSAETRAMIEGVLSVRGQRVVGRVGGSVAAGFCRGFQVTVHFDEERFSGSGVYLFAAVLERFLGLYASLNSFSKMVATTNKREEAMCRWPPRAGEKILL
jgi:type VI secretion system protein ImpG